MGYFYPFHYLCSIEFYTLLYMAGIYIHIPFCTSRCVYCDFYSTTYGEKDKAYISALTNELRLRANYLQQDGQMPVIETIYIGGGTPSTLDTSLLEPIFEVLYRTYHVSDRAEITIEANPDARQPAKHGGADIRRRQAAFAPPPT